jgi:hypothetical protein
VSLGSFTFAFNTCSIPLVLCSSLGQHGCRVAIANERGCGRVASNGSHLKPRGLDACRRHRGCKNARLLGGAAGRSVGCCLGVDCLQCASLSRCSCSVRPHSFAFKMLTK